MALSDEQQSVRALSNRLIDLQKNIRILDAIKWRDETKAEFFKHKCKVLPSVDQSYYRANPLSFEPSELISAFRTLVKDIHNQLGHYTVIAKMMVRSCEEYTRAIEMLCARGTPAFSELAMSFYGAPDDAFYPKGPKLSELGVMLGQTMDTIIPQLQNDLDEKKYTAQEAVEILQPRFKDFFIDSDAVTVEVSDTIVADAAAGADRIRLNSKVKFSERDIRYLEVHEGWVHVGTTLNGLSQPICTFLSKGTPSSSVTQEGLAVTTEVFTFSSSPLRVRKIANRIRALSMVEAGANFIDVFNFFKEQGLDDDASYTGTVRIFRGSTPDGGPFTKDLSYAKGFVLIYNFIRLCVSMDQLERIPLLFCGKSLIEDIPSLYELQQQGYISAPKYLPPQFRDLSALASWMGFSLFLNHFDLDEVATNYGYLFK